MKGQFTLELKNRFQILEDTPADDINQLCTKIEKVFTETNQEVFGHKKKERKEWISESTWKLVDERTATKQCMLTGNEDDRADAAELYKGEGQSREEGRAAGQERLYGQPSY